MSDDPLARAARALRESSDGVSSPPAIRRARLLARASLRRKRRRSAAIVLLPLAAVFAISSAWAAVTGRLPGLSALWRGAPRTGAQPVMASSRLPPRDETEEASVPLASASDAPIASASDAPIASAPVVAIASAPVVAIASAPVVAIASAPVVPIASAPVVPTRRPSTSSPSRRAAAPPAADVEESLYEEAHTAYFVARDPAAALRGWDAYLAAYPNGRFALEARYNRALSLVRLGRAVEGRAALLPFADGSNGGYRQQEGRALLDALDGAP